jgi:DNA ligase-1
MNFKPMLSATLTEELLHTLRYPLLLSPKLDGFRCIVWEGVAYSRNAKPIRNRFIQEWAADKHNLDGELIVGYPTGDDVFGRTSSGVTSAGGEPNFFYHLFDAPEGEHPNFEWRRQHVADEYREENRIVIVPHAYITQESQLLRLEQRYLDEGYEGIMLRSPAGPYKHGRSTMREQYLMKFKRFIDGEAVVIKLEEGRHNANEAFTDELGRTKRQTLQENMQGNGMVGTLICLDPTWGEIRVSAGKMTHEARKNWWAWNHGKFRTLIGQTIHWRSFGYGTKDAPRFARFYGIKED